MQLHLGRNGWNKKTVYDAIKCRGKITVALFVKEVAVAVFGTGNLLKSTMMGTASNRIKNNQPTAENTQNTIQKLDPVKVLVITGVIF